MTVVAGAVIAYFSPTGTTAKVLEGIAGGLGLPVLGRFDLTRPGYAVPGRVSKQTLLIAGAPVYGGRIPGEAVKRLAGLEGQGGPAVPVVLYGNRGYGDALRELADLLSSLEFVPVGAGAFIGEHSYSSPATPIAVGRPDSQDLAVAAAFGRRIAERLAEPVSRRKPLDLPGISPLQPRRPRTEHMPLIVDLARCRGCGTCVEVCPVGAVGEGGRVSNRETCIYCSACIKACPGQARSLPGLAASAAYLAEHCRERREPELFC